MKLKNSCYTYFAMKGNFIAEQITDMMGLTPTESWNRGDLRKSGNDRYDFSFWEYGRCDKYDIIVEHQMMETIKPLIPKIPILQTIHKQYEVEFVLEIVPVVHLKEASPALGLHKDVIAFCYQTDTCIDIDLYIEA